MNPLANPYVGLRPFESSESLLFYGRRQQIPDLLQKLYDTRFLAVVGSSGCGKSSLIRAGLIPHLQAGFLVADREQWRMVKMKPGNRPLYHLAEEINKTVFDNPDVSEHEAFYNHIQESGIRVIIERLFKFFHETDANILILVDQFEEIFRFARTKSQDEAADFVSIILALSQTKDLPVYTVLTMRSDFIGDCDTFHKLPEAMNQSQYLVPRMTREQRRQAIEGPAAVRGIKIPEHLVQRLLNDSSNNPDHLPVLQHALMRTWDKWPNNPGNPLPDIQHYDSIGGIRTALSQHADEIYFSLSESDQLIVQKLFKALTTQDTEGRCIRRNTKLNDLCQIVDASFEKVVSLLDLFRAPSCSFLMPALSVQLKPESEIDISHESLMRVWKRLDDWVAEEAESAKRYIRLAETDELNQKKEAPLLTDPELKITETWQKENTPNAAWASRYHPGFELSMDFLKESIAAREAEKIQARKNARNKNIFRFVLIAMFVLLGLSIFTGIQYQKVNKAKKTAEQLKEVAEEALKNEANARQVTEKALESEANARQVAEQALKEAQEQKRIAENQRNKIKKQLDEILQLKDTLNPLAAKQGRLYVKAKPDDAIISIDGIKKPYSDGIKLDAGNYTIRITHQNYYEKNIILKIEAGKEKQVPVVKLDPLPGNININVMPLDATVYLNAKSIGKGKLVLNDLQPDTYRIKLEKEGYETVEKKLSVGPNQLITVNERLIKYAQLTILPRPSDATVKIMNIRPVYSPGMNLLPGDYEIYVSKKGFVDFEKTIHLNEGDEINMPVELKPVEVKPIQTKGNKKSKSLKLKPTLTEPEKHFTNQFGMKFVYIKPGEFIMGSPENEKGRYENEAQHKVRLTKGFYMQTTEVTQGQWMAIMGNNPSDFKDCGKNCPVEDVSWEDVKKYIKKLNSKDGSRTYRLPTEAEWEYAARAGTTTRFSWGNDADCSKANYGNGVFSRECKGVNPGKTMKAVSFKPNLWGLYDMHGNVWEWCSDWYGKYPSTTVTDPTGPYSGALRAIRGGSWNSDAGYCRSASRYWVAPGYRSRYVGFRLVAP